MLSRYPDGISLRELHAAHATKASRKTFLRALHDLISKGLVTVSGDSRSTRYHLTKRSDLPLEQLPTVMEPPRDYMVAIPLSIAAKETLAVVSQPLERRPKVGYNPDFLRNYRPNVDYYLSAAERSQLLALGQTSQQNAPAGTYARNILHRLLIDLSWNSSRLEGNTYSLLDTKRLLELDEPNSQKTDEETEMIRNHKDAIEYLVDSAQEIGLNRHTLLNLHALLSNNLLGDRMASGRLRTFQVGIGGSSYAPPGLPAQVEEYFTLLLEKAAAIKDPFEQAFFVMVQLPYLQPFEDVNKRVSRLAANIPFNRLNLAPLSFVDVPKDIYIRGLLGVYELNRVDLYKDVFLYAYEKSAARYAQVRQTIGEPDPFWKRYREEIRATVSGIIIQALDQPQASDRTEAEAQRVPEADRLRFIEAVETELLSLHEGNYARNKVTPSQFEKWKAAWNK